MGKVVKTESSKLVCEVCGTEMMIPRKRGQRRERGHIKHMYCYHCKEKTAFIEGVKPDPNEAFWDNWHQQHDPDLRQDEGE